jgi:uncharacterized protein YjdB
MILYYVITENRFMKRIIIFLIFIHLSLVNAGQIIADHTIVAKFDDIPQYYIDEVKKMMVAFLGESHSLAYRTGMELLETSYPVYGCNVATGEEFSDQYVRVNSYGWIGEDTWFTWYAFPLGSRPGASTTIKNLITEYHAHGHPIHALGFAWCSDMTFSENGSVTDDPVYGVHWYGASKGGPDGDKGWGLDADDYSITNNNVNMTTYFDAMNDYITYCNTNGYVTKIIFTTGPVDTDSEYFSEYGYQGYIKHEAIRNYVKADPTRILFDYADILCYDDDGTPTTTTWNGYTYPSITMTNLGDGSIGHIGTAGAVRLAKAQWWLLARIAGWDGGTNNIPVTGITVTGAGGSSVISTDTGTLQLSATVTPTNATNQTIIWSIFNGTGQATISNMGLVTAISNGTVTARATSNDGSGVYGTLVITITTVTGIAGSSDKTELYKIIVTGHEIRILLNNDFISWKASLYNSQGRLISSKLVKSDVLVFDFSSFYSGIYIVVLSNRNHRQIIKVINL